ncbi:MAG: IS110 family transposase [Nitrospinae bacterium]|nr:IS110 family transposase [Nitrospinota bacterium]
MNNVSGLDFTGEDIYVGLDVHKKSWSVTILTDKFEHKTFSQPPEVEVLVRYLKRNFPGADYKSTYEAGFSGFWIHDRLKEDGVECLVVNPADVPTMDKERMSKTDRVDSRKLARSLRNGEIEGIYVPSRPKVEDRNILRSRQGMVRKQTRCKNQIKSILCFYGIKIPDKFDNGYWSKQFINWLESVKMVRTSGNLSLKVHIDELKHLRAIIAEMNLAIRAMAKSDDYRNNVRVLKSVPGISTLTAMILLTELDDINRFKTLDHLCSYVGLIPNTHSSGEKDIKTGLSRRRNSQLRFVLIESAWTAVRKDPALIMAFNDLCKRMPKSKAIVRIARKLLNRVRYVLKNQQEYVIGVVE